ncbi:MAG: GDSL-type esterase/lipase family protein [Hyphomonas sp.]
MNSVKHLVLLIAPLLLLTCSPAQAPLLLPEGNIRIEGRAAFGETGDLTVHWPGSGAHFLVQGGSLVAEIEAETRDSWLNISAGGEITPLRLRRGWHAYNLRVSSEAGPTEVRITRRTGPQTGAVTFHGFRIDGDMRPAPAPGRGLLILGDSITVGYGVLGASEACAYSPQTEDFSQTYAARLGRSFGAEVHAVAYSGRGLVRNWDGGPGTVMSEVWQWLTPEGGAWTPAAFQPDAVLIALGTNDFSTAHPGPAYAETYVRLLSDLSAAYPGARLYAVTGPLLPEDLRAPMEAETSRAVAEFAARGGPRDSQVRRVSLSLAPEGRIYGCDWHPGLDTQARMAGELAAILAEDLGWQPQSD